MTDPRPTDPTGPAVPGDPPIIRRVRADVLDDLPVATVAAVAGTVTAALLLLDGERPRRTDAGLPEGG